MITISNLIEKMTSQFADKVEVRYLHPTLYIVCTDDQFSGLQAEDRENIIIGRCDVSKVDLARVQSLGIVQLVLVSKAERNTDYSFIGASDEGQHWIAWFYKQGRQTLSAVQRQKPPIKAIHFYGFKGGQARSTVLALFAKSLADEGLRVLIVDADAEAPSLDALFSVVADAPEATLMGLCGWSDEIAPIAGTYVGKKGTGEIDLLACRPRSASYDMDFAAFLLSTVLNAAALEAATQKLRAFAERPGKGRRHRYDVVLFDHRTGLATTVLPIMNAWPGPAVLFARLDGMAHYIPDTKIFSILLSHDHDTPGAFVTFSLDAKATRDSTRITHGKVIEGLLSSLLEALAIESNELDLEPTSLEPNWIMWQYDPALLSQLPPNPLDLTQDNQSSLIQLRDVLGLETQVTVPQATIDERQLTYSGATDEGWFIQTQELKRLFVQDSNYIYILGRKGTGKTRLVRQLFQQQLGEPLLVALDFQGAGIPSLDITLLELIQKCKRNWNVFWWTLLRAALEINSTKDDLLVNKVKSLLADRAFEPEQYGAPQRVEDLVKQLKPRRIFLVDGVETAVPASDLRRFVSHSSGLWLHCNTTPTCRV